MIFLSFYGVWQQTYRYYSSLFLVPTGSNFSELTDNVQEAERVGDSGKEGGKVHKLMTVTENVEESRVPLLWYLRLSMVRIKLR